MGGIELAEERLQHFPFLEMRGVAGEIGAVAEVLSGAEEEYLDTGLPAGLVGGDHVGLAEALDVDVLAPLDLRQRLDAIAIGGRLLIGLRIGCFLHAPRQAPLDILTPARQEIPRLPHQGGVLFRPDAPDAGRGAALDLILQAGPGAGREDGVGA